MGSFSEKAFQYFLQVFLEGMAKSDDIIYLGNVPCIFENVRAYL